MQNNNLEIILITYNRKNHLENTFNQIFADNSPIKNLPITILDNKSDDGTAELINEYSKKFSNIKHIISRHNIGGDGNIVRAFEYATHKYFWILCDDDEYDFSHWTDVENAMSENYDAIVVANYVNPKQNIAQLVKQMTFVPSTIYKTENITDTVIVNMQYCISTKFSQLALACHLINENKNIKILDNWIVNMLIHGGYESYTRGMDDTRHPYLTQNFWEIGFVNAIQMIKDKKTKDFIIDNMSLISDSLLKNFITIIKTNNKKFKSLKNLTDIWAGINWKQRYIFILACMCQFPPIYMSYDPKI